MKVKHLVSSFATLIAKVAAILHCLPLQQAPVAFLIKS